MVMERGERNEKKGSRRAGGGQERRQRGRGWCFESLCEVPDTLMVKRDPYAGSIIPI